MSLFDYPKFLYNNVIDFIFIDPNSLGGLYVNKRFSCNVTALSLFILILCFVLPVHAEGPAVSGINGKIEGFGGIVNDEGSYGGAASLSIPLGNHIGFQIDGLAGEYDDQDVTSSGAHIFWRDPEVALLGAIYSNTDIDFLDFQRAGVEGEFYLNRLTLKAKVGWQGGRKIGDAVWGGGSLSYYFLENLVVQIGAQAGDDHYIAMAQAEWQPAFKILPGLTVFANGGYGDEDYDQAFFGLRYYIGSTKSLIKRHREDDPQPDLNDGIALNFRPIKTQGKGSQGSQGPQSLVCPPIDNGSNVPLNGMCVLTCNPGFTLSTGPSCLFIFDPGG